MLESATSTGFTKIDFQIKREIESLIKARLGSDSIFISAVIGSWKETQTDEQTLKMLQRLNQSPL